MTSRDGVSNVTSDTCGHGIGTAKIEGGSGLGGEPGTTAVVTAPPPAPEDQQLQGPHWLEQNDDGLKAINMALTTSLLVLLESKVFCRYSPEQLDNMRSVAAEHPPSSVMSIISTLVDLQPDLLQHKQSVLDEVSAAVAAADVAAQQALPSSSAGAAAEQNPAGGVSSLPAETTLNKPRPQAVKHVQDQKQHAQATGSGSDSAAAAPNRNQGSKPHKKRSSKSCPAAEKADRHQSSAAAAPAGHVQPAEGKPAQVAEALIQAMSVQTAAQQALLHEAVQLKLRVEARMADSVKKRSHTETLVTNLAARIRDDKREYDSTLSEFHAAIDDLVQGMGELADGGPSG